MAMVKVTPVNPKHKKIAKILEKYYSIAPYEVIETIRYEIFSPDKDLHSRRQTYEKYKKIILSLKPIFKEFVIEQNFISKNDGYPDYFEFITRSDGVPKKKLTLFLSSVSKVIKEINKRSLFFNNLPRWYWSEFNIPDPVSLVRCPEYQFPKDIYRIMDQLISGFNLYKKDIRIIDRNGFYPSARFDKESEKVIVEIDKRNHSFLNARSLIHELGHAVSFLKCKRKKIDLSTKSKYWKEKYAYKTVFKFEEKLLSEEVKNASRALLLGDFSAALFEYEMYTKPHQDFDKVYAKMINACYPHSNQEKNPFYVLENNFLLKPCSVVTASIVQVDLLTSGNF